MPSTLLTTLEGSHHAIGVGLGELARPVLGAHLEQSDAWRAVQRWRGHSLVRRLHAVASQRLPQYMEELRGIAAASGFSEDDIFLWNCRGELVNRSPDGCTTAAALAGAERFIAHNEDGDPYLLGKCALVEVRPPGAPGFIAFCYPGSLPGHTFAVNRAGVVQTINNVRLTRGGEGIPRMFLARAVLDARTLDDAVALLDGAPRAGGFHHLLGAAGDARLLSVEATPARCSVVTVTRALGHANHLVHDGHAGEAQIVTDSSRDRQARVDALLRGVGVPGRDALRGVLHDRAPAGLPIYRTDPADPDAENTLASAVFSITNRGVDLDVEVRGGAAQRMFVAAGG